MRDEKGERDEKGGREGREICGGEGRGGEERGRNGDKSGRRGRGREEREGWQGGKVGRRGRGGEKGERWGGEGEGRKTNYRYLTYFRIRAWLILGVEATSILKHRDSILSEIGVQMIQRMKHNESADQQMCES